MEESLGDAGGWGEVVVLQNEKGDKRYALALCGEWDRQYEGQGRMRFSVYVPLLAKNPADALRVGYETSRRLSGSVLLELMT